MTTTFPDPTPHLATGLATGRTSGARRAPADNQLRYVDEHIELLGCQPVTELGLGVDVMAVATANLAARRDPAGFWWVNQKVERDVQRLIDDGIGRPEVPLAGAKGRALLAEQHPVLADWWGTADERQSGDMHFEYMARWREHVPSARALWPLQNPDAPAVPFDNGAVPSADDWRVWSHVADAVGIRSRAAVAAAILEAHFRSFPRASWLSHASGAVVPVTSTAARLRAMGVECFLELWDSDDQSLALADELAERHGLADRLTGSTVDLLDLGALRATPARFDMVDILGFFEYLPSEPNGVFPTASDYLSAALSVVRPGGVLVMANMLDTHPQLDFVMRCVQWPFIQPRGLDELVELVRRAGVDDDSVTVYLPDDGVYAVIAIRV